MLFLIILAGLFGFSIGCLVSLLYAYTLFRKEVQLDRFLHNLYREALLALRKQLLITNDKDRPRDIA